MTVNPLLLEWKKRMSAEYERRIKAIDSKTYGEEVIAVSFARTSRMPGSIQESLDVLSEEKAAEFHEKWVVGYGHSSVAEHAVVHLAIENVSRLAAVAIESPRLGSYTEKSTRYQIMSPDGVIRPETVERSRWAQDYEEGVKRLFAAYQRAIEPVGDAMKRIYPAKDGESDVAHDKRVRTKYVDICRYVLPLGVLTRLGMTANARVYEAAITQMLSADLPEVQDIGADMKQAVLEVCPTLVKYADRNSYIAETREAMKGAVKRQWEERSEENYRLRPNVELVEHDLRAEDKFVASWLYRFGHGRSYKECLEKAASMEPESKKIFITEALERMGQHDKAGRELEMGDLTYDVVLDYGSYYDFKRNRMMSQVCQEVDGGLGYVLPGLMYQTGVALQAEKAIEFAHQLAGEMQSDFTGEHAYLYTNATLRRMVMKMNLRELAEFWKTRSAPNTNPGYRYLALRMGELAGAVYPNLWPLIRNRKDTEIPVSRQVYEDFYGNTGMM